MGIASTSPAAVDQCFRPQFFQTPRGLQVFPAIVEGCPPSAAFMRELSALRYRATIFRVPIKSTSVEI